LRDILFVGSNAIGAPGRRRSRSMNGHSTKIVSETGNVHAARAL
jgi:hypothetical protein